MSKRRVPVRLVVEEMNPRITPAVLATSLLAVAPVAPVAEDVHIADDVTVTVIEVRAGDTPEFNDSGEGTGDDQFIALAQESGTVGISDLSSDSDNALPPNFDDYSIFWSDDDGVILLAEAVNTDGSNAESGDLPGDYGDVLPLYFDDYHFFTSNEDGILMLDQGVVCGSSGPVEDSVLTDGEYLGDPNCHDDSVFFDFNKDAILPSDGLTSDGDAGNAPSFDQSYLEDGANFRDFFRADSSVGSQDEIFTTLVACNSQPAGQNRREEISSSLATSLIQSQGKVDFHFDLSSDARLTTTLNAGVPTAPEQSTASDAGQQATEWVVATDTHWMKTEQLELNGLLDTRLLPTL